MMAAYECWKTYCPRKGCKRSERKPFSTSTQKELVANLEPHASASHNGDQFTPGEMKQLNFWKERWNRNGDMIDEEGNAIPSASSAAARPRSQTRSRSRGRHARSRTRSRSRGRHALRLQPRSEMLNDAEDATKRMKADIDVAVEKARNTIAALRRP